MLGHLGVTWSLEQRFKDGLRLVRGSFRVWGLGFRVPGMDSKPAKP